MERRDLLLKIIAAANGKTVTPVQLQKVAFLLGMKYSNQLPEDYYNFAKYDYGPFAVEIYRDTEYLESMGLINIQVNSLGGWKEYIATTNGLAEALKDNNVPAEIGEFITETVQWARSLSFQQLVRAVYQQYPEYRENSVFQD